MNIRIPTTAHDLKHNTTGLLISETGDTCLLLYVAAQKGARVIILAFRTYMCGTTQNMPYALQNIQHILIGLQLSVNHKLLHHCKADTSLKSVNSWYRYVLYRQSIIGISGQYKVNH